MKIANNPEFIKKWEALQKEMENLLNKCYSDFGDGLSVSDAFVDVQDKLTDVMELNPK